ncbi:phage integrase SAM-like domain-containing protein [Terrimonas pollutisoli]|uniref:phage integrase SAM-like domain-containing protein n=1 Tax=Terrimonas pollutisoli TaxID=3034147 RepID=UPI0023EDE57E|nr:phage integrase SAM-like domain-containing protein [Terrimonas sp. H1YJ31]
MRLSERNSPVNHHLNRLDQKFSDFLIPNTTSLSQFTAGDIRDQIIGIRSQKPEKVAEFIDNYFEKTIVSNINFRPGTVKQYRRAINHFNRFLEINSQKTITFPQLDYVLASAFNGLRPH